MYVMGWSHFDKHWTVNVWQRRLNDVFLIICKLIDNKYYTYI